jgi:L-threonylcarbamoyladenylate synthase
MLEKEIKNCIEVLARGGTILYPTDTIWGIGCDATNPEAVEKVYQIKKRMETKSLIILLDDQEKLLDYTKTVPEIAFDLLKSVHTPLTIIYPDARNLAPNVIAEDGSIAIRITKNKFCKKLIAAYGKPIVSTSANISGQPAPLIFKRIPAEILGQVDYTVNMYQEVLGEVKPSTIIRLKITGEFEIIRK